MICPVCNKEFVQRMNGHGGTKTCSVECGRIRSTKVIEIVCRCGKHFKQIRNTQKFCSTACGNRYRLYKNGRNKVAKECFHCGAKTTKKFCSVKCSNESKKQTRLNKWLSSGKTEGTNAWGLAQRARYIRDYILESQLGKCAICSINPIWNDKPIVFVLDHIDGNHLDNNVHNLRLICPNCDSQLDTYKAKNKGKGRAWRRTDK